MTIIPIAYFLDNGYEHLYLSFWSQVVHAIYSSWKYYGTKVPYLTTFPLIFKELGDKNKKTQLVGIKKISCFFGSASLFFLASHVYAPEWDTAVIGILCLFTGVIHFYTMEIDYKYVLRVRTTGNLAFLYCSLAMIGLAVWGTKI